MKKRPPRENTKLTFEEAEAIRMAYRLNPRASYRKLAEQYGVSKTLIAKIIKNKIYRADTYLKEEGNEKQDFID